MEEFGKRLRCARTSTGLHQKEVASKINLSTSGYGYYEQGRSEPSLETLKQIALILNVSTDYLLGIIDNPNSPITFPISDNLNLSREEFFVVQKMKDLSLLGEISSDPDKNVPRLQRYWNFIKEEHNLDD